MLHFRRWLRRRNKFWRIYEATPARQKAWSILASADDDPAKPSKRLIDVALAAASRARSIEVHAFDGRASSEPHWWETWPGEHYKLLAALVAELSAKRVVEIGAFTGLGTLTLAEALPADGSVTTFDIAPWRDFAETWFVEADFASGRISRRSPTSPSRAESCPIARCSRRPTSSSSTGRRTASPNASSSRRSPR